MSRFYCIMRKKPDGSIVDLTEQISKGVLNTDKNIVGYQNACDARIVLATYLWSVSRGQFFDDEDYWSNDINHPFDSSNVVERMKLISEFRERFNAVLSGKEAKAFGGTYYTLLRKDEDIDKDGWNRHFNVVGGPDKKKLLVYLDGELEDIEYA